MTYGEQLFAYILTTSSGQRTLLYREEDIVIHQSEVQIC